MATFTSRTHGFMGAILVAMEIRLGQVIESRGGAEGEIIALAVSTSAWMLRRVLVEPEHRLGLGRWVPFELLEDHDGQVTAAVDHDGFDSLPAGETTELVEGVGTKVPYVPSVPVVRRVASKVTARGERVLNSDTPLVADGAEIGRFCGMEVDPSGQVESLSSKHHKIFGQAEEVIPISQASLSEAGIRIDS